MNSLTMVPIRVWIIAVTACGFFTAGAVRAQQPGAKEPERHRGFYAGMLGLYFMGGSVLGESGSMIHHEREVQSDLRARNATGVRDVRLLGTTGLPPGFVAGPRIEPGPSSSALIEYGVTDFFGLGAYVNRMSVHSTRQVERLMFAPPPTGSTVAVANAFIDAVPETVDLVDSRSITLHGAFHPFPKHLFDLWLAARLGYVDIKTSYRPLPALPQSPWQSGPERGSGYTLGVAIGTAAYLTDEFGLCAELAFSDQTLRSGLFSRETLRFTTLSAGVFFNFDNIRRY